MIKSRYKFVDSSQESQKCKSDAGVAICAIPKRILVVEDNNLNRRLFKDYLTLCGYQVRTLACGCHFFEEIIRFQPDLILLDLKLPSIDGYTLLEQMRVSPQWQHIPVIIVSVVDWNKKQGLTLNLGTHTYFSKPVSASTLSQAIAEKLQ